MQKKFLTLIIKAGEDVWMKYYKHLYIGESLRKKKKKVLARLEKRKFMPGIYLIVLCGPGRNQLEIFNVSQLLQKGYPERDYFVVGIAKGFDESAEILEEIAKSVYNETRGADIRSYILNKEQEG